MGGGGSMLDGWPMRGMPERLISDSSARIKALAVHDFYVLSTQIAATKCLRTIRALVRTFASVRLKRWEVTIEMHVQSYQHVMAQVITVAHAMTAFGALKSAQFSSFSISQMIPLRLTCAAPSSQHISPRRQPDAARCYFCCRSATCALWRKLRANSLSRSSFVLCLECFAGAQSAAQFAVQPTWRITVAALSSLSAIVPCSHCDRRQHDRAHLSPHCMSCTDPRWSVATPEEATTVVLVAVAPWSWSTQRAAELIVECFTPTDVVTLSSEKSARLHKRAKDGA